MWKPMLPTFVEELSKDTEKWLFEVKYDGFRCGLEWTKDKITLWSRNGHDLTPNFPEIVLWCQNNQSYINHLLPLFLDGELVVLKTPYHSIFSLVQQRGRLQSKEKILSFSQKRPATFMVFDMLKSEGKSLQNKILAERRKYVEELFSRFGSFKGRLQIVKVYRSLRDLEQIVFLHQAEGIVAKQRDSKYAEAKRTNKWLKWKNFRSVQGFITSWNANNDYFQVEIMSDHPTSSLPIGKVKNGLKENEKVTLKRFFKEKGYKLNGFSWSLPPSICVDIHCLNVKKEELREPLFRQFRFDLSPEECTWEKVRIGLAQLPDEIDITKPDKNLFPSVNKRNYVLFLREVAPFLLHKLQNKRLTIIRYPDGVNESFFYQKHLPEYAPSYIESVIGEDGEKDLLCNNLRSLLWFGNHGALEFHAPFQQVDSSYPDEMVFDLDPPSLNEFSLAVSAAHYIREMVESRGYQTFAKTSGKTGLQVHIPLEQSSMSFQETREFMEAVAKVLVDKFPSSFTIERLKKNRGKRLYIDYVQHAQGKTIIAPYSPRATKEATVATPLYWEEVNENLNPKNYTIHNISQRLTEKGCPMQQIDIAD
ncbi:DNA ligase D [Gracilibacillus sp. YIM 98692]|uniref:DNA ligase D n=1 Tax=Gracilibacillus sp. YIM 98692 TaxID=2663532 RepID=UPI0013D17A8F|nr:DNA ligase D [Gracilibacillus sp. YIM 98692]